MHIMLSSYCDSEVEFDWHIHHHAITMWLRSLCSPNEDVGRMNKRWNADFRLRFQWFVAQIEYSRPWKVLRKSAFHLLFIVPKSSFGMDKVEFDWHIHHHATIILRVGHAHHAIIILWLWSWVRLTHPSSCYHHLVTLKFMLPKRRCWKDEQKMKSGFSSPTSTLPTGNGTPKRSLTDFSMVRSPNRVLTPLKSASKIRISSFVHTSKIFVWKG